MEHILPNNDLANNTFPAITFPENQPYYRVVTTRDNYPEPNITEFVFCDEIVSYGYRCGSMLVWLHRGFRIHDNERRPVYLIGASFFSHFVCLTSKLNLEDFRQIDPVDPIGLPIPRSANPSFPVQIRFVPGDNMTFRTSIWTFNHPGHEYQLTSIYSINNTINGTEFVTYDNPHMVTIVVDITNNNYSCHFCQWGPNVQNNPNDEDDDYQDDDYQDDDY